MAVRVALLSTGEGWHVQDLFRAARQLSIELLPADFKGLSASVPSSGGSILSRARGLLPSRIDLLEADRVLVRSMPVGSLEQVIFRMDVLHSLQARGVPVVNGPRALEAAIDKYLCAARMDSFGLPVPALAVCEKAEDALEAFERLGGDVVLKPIFGSEGRGIARLTSLAAARGHFEELEAGGAVIHLQRFVDHPGFDYRILVLGNEVLCGMRRVAAAGGWITNIAQGATAEPLSPSPEISSLALRAARSIGAEVAGVDILPDRAGKLWLLEVNAVPGWRALSAASGVDVAVEVLKHVASGEG
jgi:ribosomal protein S6--L-glutamate ligase